MSWQSELALAEAAARRAGALLRERRGADQEVLREEGRDLKLGADREAEALILDTLSPSGLPLLAEESGAHGALSDGPHWIVDPLDGTVNFSRGLPLFCVSVALWDDTGPLLGVILDVAAGDLYAAIAGGAARCNGAPIRVSSLRSPARAILATGFPVQRDFGAAALQEFLRSVQRYKKIRMFGSAALSLAYVAAGKADVYAEDGVMLWDVAAGLALVRAAGGAVEYRPSPRHPWALDVVCGAAPELWRETAGAEGAS